MTTTEQKRRSGGRSTAEERARVRAKTTCEKRTAFYAARMLAAESSLDQLNEACDYLRAVADDLADEKVKELTAAVTRMADERNKT